MRATLSHAEPRRPRWRLHSAVRAHDGGGALTMAAARSRWTRAGSLWPRRQPL